MNIYLHMYSELSLLLQGYNFLLFLCFLSATFLCKNDIDIRVIAEMEFSVF